MSHAVMITTPARNAMEGHGLTDARTILASDADLHPKRQGLSVTPRAVAYSVYCPSTERYSLVTLDGRWIIPGREGYKTRGPVKSFARKNIADVRPDGLVILEPVRHNGRYAVTRYGQRRAGICRGVVSYGQYGYSCHCGASLTWDEVNRDGFVTVTDGRRGTHVQAYAVRREHGVEWSQDVAMRHDAPVVAATPFRPAAEVIAEGHARKAAETAAVAESAPVPAPVADVDTLDVPADAEAPFCAPYSVAEYSFTPNVSAVGRIAYGALKPVKRWKVVDANGRVASDDHLSRLAADTRADFLNGESGHGQTPDTCPEGTPDNVRHLVSVGAHGRAYVTGGGARLNIESADGRARYTLLTVPDEAHQEARGGFHTHARELSGEIVKRGDGRPVFKPAKVQMWSGKPAPRKAFEPKDYAPGSMLAWVVDGVRFTGQVWANRVASGKWNGDRGECSAVVVATVDGRRARRDEAVCLPFVHGSRRKTSYAFVATQHGNADVEVIPPECASDGLFDVVATTVDPIEGWESDGGYVPGVEPADAPAETSAPEAPAEPADAPAETAAPEAPAGAHCHRCGTDTVFGAECRTCGRVDIVAALMPSGPVLCPAEEKAMATGRQYCPRCFTVGVALYAATLHTGPGYVCAECYTAHGRRLPEAGPAPVKAPAGDVVRAARAARREAEESGASVGEIHRAGEAARKAVAVAYGERPADVISDPCSVDVWEDEGGACIGVDRPSEPDAGSGAAPVGSDPSPEMGTCTAPAVDVTPVLPDFVSDPDAVDTWDGEGGAVPGIEAPCACLAGERRGPDPYAARSTVADWVTTPGTNRRTATLTCAGEEYRVYHAPDAVLPYSVRRTVGGADVDLGGWVGMDDVRAIVRADRRRTAALEADRRRVEQEQRRAVYRLQGERRQAPVRLTEEERGAIARRAEEKHRPVAAELYVSPITGNAVLAFVCGMCGNAHDDALGRPQTIGGRYRTPLSVERGALAALVEKRGWRITGPWRAHGARGDTMRAPIAPTLAYLAWVDAMYGPDPVTPKVEAGERITPVQRGWWDVVSKEGRRYELTWRPSLTGPVWSVRRRSIAGFETVARTGMATTVLTGMRVDSTERGNQAGDAGDPEPVHVPLAS